MSIRESADIKPTGSCWKGRLLPIALLLICANWIFILHIYLPPERFFIPRLLITVAFLTLLVRSVSRNREPWTDNLMKPKWSVFIGVPACIIALLFFPYPYNLGFWPLGVGWILLAVTRSHSLSRYFAAAVVQIGLLLMVTAAALPILSAWTARVHELSGPAYFFTPLLGWLLKILGQPLDFIGGGLYLRTFEDLFPQTVTLEKLFPMPLLMFGVIWSAIVLFRSRKQRLERLLFFGVVFSIFGVVRLAVLMLIMIQRVAPSYFWEPIPMLLSALPIAFLVKEPFDLPHLKKSAGARALTKTPGWSGLILGLILGASLVGWLTFRDPGTPKPGRIKINEHGSNWEWTTEPMDTIQYNEKTTYNYYCLTEFLKKYYDVTINTDKLSPDVLKNTDVLILKMPTQPYAPEEINAVVDFIERGGGVWVIGDHTNVFGSSSFFNPLLERFKCRLQYNSTHDLKTGKLTLYEKPEIFAHPSVINLPPYLFATSCSMNAPWSADAAILGYGLRTDHLDYSQKNFFPDRSRKLFNIGFGLFLQQTAVSSGKGRLLIYTDSTTFSNFFMFIRGKPELALGTIEWLNRRNRLHWINTLLLIIAVLTAGLLLFLKHWNGATLAGLLIGTSLMGWFTNANAKAHYPLPQPKQSVPWVNFEREHSRYFLPTLRLSEQGDPDYLTFFVWTQRVGAVPREMYDFDQAVKSNDPLIIIDPAVPLDNGEMSALKHYVEKGGKLLLMNAADNESDVPQQIASVFGLTLLTESCPSDTLHTLTLAGRYFPLRFNGKFSRIQGGEAFLRSDQGDVIGASKVIGAGKIWVISCGHLFRVSGMGTTTMVPDEGLKALYQIEYGIILGMMGRSASDEGK